MCVQRKLKTFARRLEEAFSADVLRAYVCVLGWLRGEFSEYTFNNHDPGAAYP